jgi:uncharacterized protein
VRVDGAKAATLTAGDTLRVDAAQAVDIETQGEGAVLAIALDRQQSPS